VDATFRAAALFNSGRSGRGSSERAIALLEEATRYDPSFAPAYAELSQVYSWIGASFPELRTRAAETARSCAARALALDPNDGLSRFASALIALFFDWDWPLAESELERSIELGFDRSAAELMIAQVMVITGRRAEGLRLGESAMAAAPLATHLRGVWARLLFMTGDAARAAEEAERVLEVNPEMPGVLQILHDAYSSLGRGEDAAEVGRRMAGAWPERAPQMAEYQRLHRDQGRAGSRAFWQQDTEQRGYLFWAAVNRTTAAEIDAAFALLERAFRERDPDLRWLVTFPGLAPLHADPRFADLARRMNLPLPTD
jgi:tetratricopeptide (TPR) repeat protein